MAVIYELRGQPAAFGELGLNLYSGCAVGCRYCYFVGLNRVTWERWTTDVQPRRNILFTLKREAKKMEGDPREIIVCPAADPYQSDEAARLTRKALLILEQYHLRVQVLTVCGHRSVADFDILAQPLEICDADSFSVGKPARAVGTRRCANRRARPDSPRSPCGGNLHVGENLSGGLSGRIDRRGRVVADRRGRVDTRQASPRRVAAESDRRSTPPLFRRRHRPSLSAPHGREGLER